MSEFDLELMDSFSSANAEYPIIGRSGVTSTNSPEEDSKGRSIEFWAPGEPGSTDSPRPPGLPLDKPGVQTFGNKATPLDILGDVTSHHLIKSDPVIKDYYQKFSDSLTEDQHTTLNKQYLYAKENLEEKRSYDQWKESSGVPAYFRGYAFKQWPQEFNDKAYTSEQKKMFDSMLGYLGGHSHLLEPLKE